MSSQFCSVTSRGFNKHNLRIKYRLGRVSLRLFGPAGTRARPGCCSRSVWGRSGSLPPDRPPPPRASSRRCAAPRRPRPAPPLSPLPPRFCLFRDYPRRFRCPVCFHKRKTSSRRWISTAAVAAHVYTPPSSRRELTNPTTARRKLMNIN